MKNPLPFLAPFLVMLLAAAALAAQEPLPRGFRDIELGMSLDKVKEILRIDPFFDYRGDPDVSLIPSSEQRVIEANGVTFIRKGFFQFHEDRLYIIILQLDPRKMDYFSMYTNLKRKYGDQTELDPSEAVWDSADVRVSLERPLSMKYIDKPVFERLKEQGRMEESLQNLSRERFLELF